MREFHERVVVDLNRVGACALYPQPEEIRANFLEERAQGTGTHAFRSHARTQRANRALEGRGPRERQQAEQLCNGT